MVIGQFSPGPDMLLLTKNALNHTFRAALFTVAGITTGIVVHTLVALTGLGLVDVVYVDGFTLHVPWFGGGRRIRIIRFDRCLFRTAQRHRGHHASDDQCD